MDSRSGGDDAGGDATGPTPADAAARNGRTGSALSDCFTPGTRAFAATIVAAVYLVLSVAAVLAVEGWGWAVPEILTFPAGWLSMSGISFLLGNPVPGREADAFRLAIENDLAVVVYGVLGPVWIWLVVRGVTRLILGPEPRGR